MSYGLAQFGLAAANSYNDGIAANKAKAEADEVKQYERGRQNVIDLQAQEKHNIGMKQDTITLAGQEKKQKIDNDVFNYEETANNAAYLKSIQDPAAAADTIIRGANRHSGIPFKIDIERDEAGKVIQRTDDDGNPYYYQTIYDKESGLPVGEPQAMTLDQLENSLNQLNSGKSIAEATAAYQQKLAEEQRKAQSELTMYGAKKNIDIKAEGIKSERDHIYKVDEMGIKHGYTLDELGVKHGYTIDLEGIRHANRIDLSNVQSTNRINEYVGRSDVDGGGTPIIGGNDGSVAGIIASLTGSESGGNSGANRTNTDGRSFGGLLQMGDARLADYAKSTGTQPISAMQFKNLSASQQRAVNEWHISDLRKAAQATGAIGKTINGVPVTMGGLVAVAHLGGKGGMTKFVQSNGKYNPSDELGTSLTDYLRKHGGGGIQVARSVPAVPKATGGKGNNKTGDSGKGINTPQDYNATIDKGVDTALKSVKNYGLKTGPATTASFARAGRKLKDMGSAKNEAEFLSLYQEAFDLVIGAMPERDIKKMSKANKNELGHKVLLSMVGASSLGNLKQIVYNVNPSAKGGEQYNPSPMLPGQQPRPVKQTPQVGKLAGLYASNKTTPIRTDPKANENRKALESLSNNMEW